MTIDHVLSALADPTRRALLARLEQGEASLGALAHPLPISLMAVQKHVAVLEKAGLVATRKRGRSRLVRLRTDGLHETLDWIRKANQRWETRQGKQETSATEVNP